jgi:cytoskeletal protein CcmA (bactofilin family)
MIVGEHMLFRGDIEGDEDLIVRGRVEGTVRITGALTVEPGGQVAAEVVARTATIYGAVLGNISATESIEVARTGQMIGDAVAPRVAIVPGAAFRGRVEMRPVEAEAPHAELAPPTVNAPPPQKPRLREIPKMAAPARGPMRRREAR